MKPVSQAIADHVILQEMATSIRQHLAAAYLECSALSHDLSLLDPDAVMAAINAEFGPDGSVRDCFSDAFHTALCAVADAGGEPITAKPLYSMNAHVNPLFAQIINTTVGGL